MPIVPTKIIPAISYVSRLRLNGPHSARDVCERPVNFTEH